MRLENRGVLTRLDGTARRLGTASSLGFILTFLYACVASARYPELPADSRVGMYAAIGMLISLGLLLFASTTQLASLWGRRAEGPVEASEAGVTVPFRSRGPRTIERSAIAAGFVLRDGARATTELRLRDGDGVEIEVRDEQEGEALLDALDLAPHERALEMRLGGAVLSMVTALVALVPGFFAASLASLAVGNLLSLPSAALGFMIFALTAASVPASQWLFANATVVVGRDGVSLQQGPRRWFVANADVRAVGVQGSRVILTLTDGRTKVIPTRGTSAERREALVERIREALRESARPASLSVRLAALDRGQRSHAEWEQALRALAAQPDDYRASGLSRDELLAVIDGAHASAERKVAAAFVLSLRERDTAAERVRVALAVTAQPAVRVALERASEGTLDEAAIAEVEASRVRVR